MSSRTVRVAAYGFFGVGNIGNEGSLAAFLSFMHETRPDVAVSCFATDADTVRRDHVIPATQLMTFRASTQRGGPLVKATKAASRLWDIPRTFALMRDVDILVVPGTGVLETQLVATPWGLPYWLFIAALSCRLRGRKVALVSVGAEYATHPVTRWLFRWTVRLSHYCSYRDDESREAVRQMGVKGRLGGVFPDLAFSLPTPEGRPARPGHVVVGVMAYDGRPGHPHRGPGARRTYAEDMSRLIARLADNGRTVTMVVGDTQDHELSAEIEGMVRSRRPDLPKGRVTVSSARTLADLMVEMTAAEVVVASRFHNLICALKLAKPTVSLGYAEKNARLLAKFGLEGFSQPVDSFDVDRLAAHIEEVARVQASVEPVMKETLRSFEDELGQQFRRLSSELFRRRGHRP